MLDSRLLHKTTSYLKSKIVWLDSPNEWMYHGINSELDVDRIVLLIHSFFIEQSNYYVLMERENSGTCTRDDLRTLLLTRIGKDNFQLWDLELKKVVEFDKIAVMRMGRIE